MKETPPPQVNDKVQIQKYKLWKRKGVVIKKFTYRSNTIQLNNVSGVARNFLEGGSKSSKMSATMVDRQRKFRVMERLKR